MKMALHGAALLVCAALQSTWFNSIAFLGVKPNLFFVYVIVISFFCNKFECAAIGCAFGLVLDILSAELLGVNMIIYLITGFLISTFCERVMRKNNILITALVVLIISFIYEIIYYAFLCLFSDGARSFSAIKNVLFTESFYNAVVALLIYRLIYKLVQRLYNDKGEGIG